MFNLKHKRILMIGAVDALARSLANHLIAHGARVALRDSGALALTDPDAAFAVFTYLEDFDVLVVNPPWQRFGDFLDTTAADWDTALAANFEQMTYGLQAAAKHLIAAGTPGRLIALASVMGTMPFIGASVYGTTMSMLYALVRMAAVDLAPHGITVNALGLGWVDSADFAALPPDVQAHIRAGIPRGSPTTTGEIAAALAFLASDASSGITGAWLAVDSGYALTRSPGRSIFER
ncbi:MAG: SDR family oxidoreductase [Anaerolinea sp.]|nr:SDR family oxidoreductase [Anaerolinea sp.]